MVSRPNRWQMLFPQSSTKHASVPAPSAIALRMPAVGVGALTNDAARLASTIAAMLLPTAAVCFQPITSELRVVGIRTTLSSLNAAVHGFQ